MIPKSMSINVEQCHNHPDIVASETCNDCHRYFCDHCLQPYDLITKSDESITVYLCPCCLRKRVLQKANRCIYGGIFFLLSGIFFAIFVMPNVEFLYGFFFSAMFAFLGAVILAYGVLERRDAANETSVSKPQIEEEKKEEPNAALQNGNVDEFYGKLLTYYETRWGPETGKTWLDRDIWAHTRRGATFAEAVNRIYRQEEKNIKCGNS